MPRDNALARYFSSPDYLDQPVISGRKMPTDEQIEGAESKYRKKCQRGSARLLAAMGRVTGQDVPEFVEPAMSDDEPVTPRDAFQIAEVQRVVAVHFDIPLAEMTSDRRFRGVARPRQVAMYLCTTKTPRSLAEIGRRFRRDHTTVIHAVKAVEKLRAADPEFDEKVRELEARL